MGLLDRLERALEALIEGRLMGRFAGRIHPLEIARRLAREMQAGRRISVKRVYVPNCFTVTLSPRDAAPLQAIASEVVREITDFLEDQAKTREFYLPGPIEVHIRQDEDVPEGEIRAEAEFVTAPDTTRELSPGEAPLSDEGPPQSHPAETARALLTGRSGFVRGRVLHLESDSISLGRTEENDLPIPDPQVSRAHAVFEWTGQTYRLRDLESRNGVKVNGQRIHDPHELKNGDVIEVGTSTMVYGSLQADAVPRR